MRFGFVAQGSDFCGEFYLGIVIARKVFIIAFYKLLFIKLQRINLHTIGHYSNLMDY